MPQIDEHNNDFAEIVCSDDQDERVENLNCANQLTNFLLECQAIVTEALNIQEAAETIAEEARYLAEPVAETTGDDDGTEELSATLEVDAIVAGTLQIQHEAEASATMGAACTEPQPADDKTQAPQDLAGDPAPAQEASGAIAKPPSVGPELTQETTQSQDNDISVPATSNLKPKYCPAKGDLDAAPSVSMKQEIDSDD